MLVPVLLFLVGLVLLIKGGDLFVDGATGIAQHFHLPELLIGATVVSIGTTLPEVMVSCQAALKGSGGISYGNAIGSIICNTSLIAAITVAVKPSLVKRKSLMLPAGFFFGAAIFYSIVAYSTGRFERWQGLTLLACFVVYMCVLLVQMKKNPEEPSSDPSESVQEKPMVQNVVMLVIGAAAIAVGANLLVDNGTKIAQALGVPDSVIGLTMVALGTSLPELVTAITALSKGHGALSLGNVIGANLFNLVLVSGLAITIAPFGIPTERTINGINSSLMVDIPVMFIVMGLLCVPALLKEKLARWQGILLLAIYAGFTVYQFVG